MAYLYQVTSEPMPGMLFLSEGNYLFYRYETRAAVLKHLNQVCSEWILEKSGRNTITADTDAGCDRICEYREYILPVSKNVLLKGDEVIGFYFDFGDYYNISNKRPNVHAFLLSAPETHLYPQDIYCRYRLLRREPGKEYKNTQRIY